MSGPRVRNHSHRRLATAHGCVVHGSKGRSPFSPWTCLKASRRHSHTSEVHRWRCLTGSGTHAPGRFRLLATMDGPSPPVASPSGHKQGTPGQPHFTVEEGPRVVWSWCPCCYALCGSPATVLNWPLRSIPESTTNFRTLEQDPSVSVFVKDKHVDTPVPLHGGSKYHGFDQDNRMTLDSTTGLHVEMRCVTSVAKDSHVDDASTLPDMLSQLATQPATV